MGTQTSDLIVALGGNDLVNGVGGNDVLRGDAGNDSLYGGDGDDRLEGGDGNDLLNGDAGNDKLFGGAGLDTLNGGIGNDFLAGGLDNDRLRGDAGDDSLYGEEGDDILEGGDGNDLLAGRVGNDVLNGGFGNDVLVGGADADTFVFSDFGPTDRDIITDFALGIDKVRLANSGFADFASLQTAMTTVAGTHTLITFATGATIQINNILPGALQASDFEFTVSAEPQSGKADVAEVPTEAVTFVSNFDFSGLERSINGADQMPSLASMSTVAEGESMNASEPSWLDSFDLAPDQFDFRGPDTVDWNGA